MRIIISIFILFFSKSIFSDEITDFEINGFSVGISLLEFLTEKEIINKHTTKLNKVIIKKWVL